MSVVYIWGKNEKKKKIDRGGAKMQMTRLRGGVYSLRARDRREGEYRREDDSRMRATAKIDRG